VLEGAWLWARKGDGVLAVLRSILRFPVAYQMFQGAIAGSFWTAYIDEYLRPKPGMRVLDIGCGPASILAHLPPVEYVGIDISPEYIEAARRRFGTRAEFRCESITATTLSERHAFDLVMANGVLHHLDDTEAGKLFAVAAAALRPQGRLVTLDGCFVDGQSPLARWLLRRDRGKYVRTEPAYRRLAGAHFRQVHSTLRHDLLRLPYTHLIMECRDL
jgi:SAM-dependent methyltransferase